MLIRVKLVYLYVRKIILIFSLLLLALFSRAQDYASLDSLMTGYTIAMQLEDDEDKCKEVDFMIGTAKDSLVRQHIALWLFDYYKESKVMGEEAVAVHIYDKWLADGTIKMRGEFDLMDAQLFANFNRSSLIGMDAPKITLLKPCGGSETIPVDGKPALLWFYDTGCSKCQLEAKLLPDVLNKEVDFPIDFYAVYSGQDKKAWKAFRRSFKLKNRNIRLRHFWDPEIESDYLRLYGVISTPKLYMIDSKGSIIGRRLEVESLPQILDVAKTIEDYYKSIEK